MAILHYAQAILISLPSAGSGQNVVGMFFFLAWALAFRSLTFKQLNDVTFCIKYLRYLQYQPLESFGIMIPPNDVKGFLVLALGVQVETGSGDVVRDVDEMMVLCQELLDSGISGEPLAGVIGALCLAVGANIGQLPDQQPPEQMIKCLRETNMRLDSHTYGHSLAWFLKIRFEATFSIDDYEEAMAILDKIMASRSHENCSKSKSCVERASHLCLLMAGARMYIYGELEYLEEAIDRCRAFLSIVSADDPLHLHYTRWLARLLEQRSRDLGVTEGLQEAHSIGLEVAHFPSFSHLAASLAKYTSPIPHYLMKQEDLLDFVALVNSMEFAADIPDIEGAIKCCRLSLTLLHPSDPLVSHPASCLGHLLFHEFRRTDKIDYLHEAITVLRGIFKLPGAQWNHFSLSRVLLTFLFSRFSLLNDRKDLDEVMQLFSVAVNDTRASAPDRFETSCAWADDARTYMHPTTSIAYESAISLMQDSLLFAPTLETQHHGLVKSRDSSEKLPLDLASYQISRDQLKEAIENLERGRALLWSEMRGFRTSIDHLRAVDSHLAESFTAVNRKLEMLITSVFPDVAIHGGDERSEGTGAFGRLVVQQRKLLAERYELVSRIQALPGLGNFLKTLQFDTLRSAALHGPVIIINHSKWRSDILVLLHDAHPSLITTTDDFYDRAIELRGRLVRTRNECVLESKRYEHALRSVLKSLYELVGQPVIKELRRLKIREQSRIWWCPTSVFCSLPLHAMGPIPSNDGIKRYFSDLYIPSYTPTLNALIESRKPGRSSLDKPSVLLVANPDGNLLQAWPEIWFIQRLGTKVTTLIGKSATPSSVVEGLKDHQFTHFVCHGNLKPEKPFNASFGLYGGKHLTLLDIVRSRLPSAEFAFLSACHTAELTEGSIADEGLHLTAAVQYCGFRSVVGTMWAMADQDGEGLVELFYNSIFSGDESGLPYYERSAKALRDAVQSLRRKKMLPLERWVNFVHYGA